MIKIEIKVTVAEISAMAPALKELSIAKLPVATSFKISKILREVQDQFDFITAESQKIIGRYTEEGATPETKKDGTVYLPITEENQEKLRADLAELDRQKVVIQVEKINLEELQTIYLTPQEVLSLEKLINME